MFTLSLISALDGGQGHAPLALPQDKEHMPILYETGWVPVSVWQYLIKNIHYLPGDYTLFPVKILMVM